MKISHTSFFTAAPFIYEANKEKKELSTLQKCLAIGVAILIGTFTFGIGGVFAFFCIAKTLRKRQIQQLEKSGTPLFRLNSKNSLINGKAGAESSLPAIITCPLTDYPQFTELDNLQADLGSKKIPLDVKNTARKLEQPNKILSENFDEATRCFEKCTPGLPKETHAVIRKYFTSIDLVSFDELMRGLKGCCVFLNQRLGKEGYVIATGSHSSHEWAATLALPFMNTKPVGHFNIGKPSAGGDLDVTDIPSSVNNYVFFQTILHPSCIPEIILEKVKKELHPHPSKQLFLVIPFLSDVAKMEIKCQIEEAKLGKQIHLITTNRPLVTLKDKFSDEELRLIIDFHNTFEPNRDWETEFSGRYLSIPEWHTPANTDKFVPETLKYLKKDGGTLRFVTDFTAPYLSYSPKEH